MSTGVKSDAYTIERLRLDQIDKVIDVHMRAFPSFFLTLLGPAFLSEFYRSFALNRTGLGFVAFSETGGVIGAIVGPLDPRGYFRGLLLRRWWAFGLASVEAVLRRPTVLPRLVRAARYRGEVPSGPVRALLSSITVAPEAQGRGLGRLLLRRWIDEAKRRGAMGAYLTTDADGNETVNRFYVRYGWQLESCYCTPEGRRMNRYVIDFPPMPMDSSPSTAAD